jgi:hypothetical protein
MDILNRIVEAVAQKLIFIRLEEKQDYAYSHKLDSKDPNAGKKSGSANPRNPKKNKSQEDASKRFSPDGKTPVKPLTPQQAGASGNQRGRFNDDGDLSSPYGAGRRKKAPKVKPMSKDGDSKKGGQELKQSAEAQRKRLPLLKSILRQRNARKAKK